MKIVEIPIFSCADKSNTLPWAEFDFDPNTHTVTIHAFNGLANTDHIANKTERKFVLQNGEPHALIITNNGEVEYLPFSKLPVTCYAHLAFYYPATQTLERLKFIEMHDDHSE